MTRAPRGGRLRAFEAAALAPSEAGAAGCIGLVLVATVGALALGLETVTPGLARAALILGLVITSGAALAAVLRAMDRIPATRARSGAAVGRAARRSLSRLTRLGARAERSPERFGPRHVESLRKTLSALDHPTLLPWIPPDVLGRAQLLLARTVWATGARGRDESAARERILVHLREAAARLDDPAPALADLAAMGAAAPLAALVGDETARRLRVRDSTSKGEPSRGDPRWPAQAAAETEAESESRAEEEAARTAEAQRLRGKQSC